MAHSMVTNRKGMNLVLFLILGATVRCQARVFFLLKVAQGTLCVSRFFLFDK